MVPREAVAVGQRGGQDNLLEWGGERRRCTGGEEVADAGEVAAADSSDGEADATATAEPQRARQAACRDSSFPLNFSALSWIIKYVYIFLLILYDIRNF